MSAVTIAVNLIGNDGTGSAFAGMTGNVLRLTGSLGQLSNLFDKLGPGVVGAGIAAGVGAIAFKGLFDIVSTGIKDAADFEYSMVSLENALQSNAEMAPILGSAIQDMAIRTVFSITDATDAFTQLTEMGFSAQETLYGFGPAASALMDGTYHATQALDGLGNQALDLAQAMRTDATQGAELLGATLNTFANEGLTAKEAADLLAGAFLNGVPSASALAQGIAGGGAAAATAGVKLQEYLAILDILAQSGLSASTAAASLQYYIQTLTAPIPKQKKELADLGLVILGGADGMQVLSSKLYDASGNFIGLAKSVDLLNTVLDGKTQEQKLEIIAQLFNVRSGKAAKILANVEDFDAKYKGLIDRFQKTDVSAMADKQLHTLLGAWDAFKDTFTSTLISIFSPLEKQLAEPILKINDLIGWLGKLPEATRKGFAEFFVVAAAAAGIVAIVGAVATVVGIMGALGITFGTIAIPIGIAAGAIAGVVAAFFAAKFTVEQLQPHLKEIMDIFHKVTDFVHQTADALRIYLSPWIAIVAGAFDKLGQVGKIIGPWLKTLSDFFRDVLGPILDMIGTRLKESLIPAWDHLREALGKLWTALQPAMPLFMAIGQFLGVVLLGLLGLVISGIVGVISGIATFLSGVVGFIAGVATIFIGIFEVAVGIVTTVFKVIEALATGHIDQVWGILRDGWNMIWQGIQDIVSGLWTAVLGLFNMTIGMIIAVIVGFYYSVVGWFQGLYDTIVGHSIIPDMVNAIVSWIQQLPGRVGAALSAMVSVGVSKAIEFKDGLVNKATEIVGRMASLAQNVVDAARNGLAGLAAVGMNAAKGLIDNLVGGLRAGIGRVAGVIGDIAGKIGSLLHHSVPDEGPLKDDDEWGGDFIDNLVNGMHSRMDTLKSAAQLAATSLSSPFSTPGTYASAYTGGQGQVVIPITLDGKEIASYTVDIMSRKVRQNGSSRYGR